MIMLKYFLKSFLNELKFSSFFLMVLHDAQVWQFLLTVWCYYRSSDLQLAIALQQQEFEQQPQRQNVQQPPIVGASRLVTGPQVFYSLFHLNILNNCHLSVWSLILGSYIGVCALICGVKGFLFPNTAGLTWVFKRSDKLLLWNILCLVRELFRWKSYALQRWGYEVGTFYHYFSSSVEW